MGKYGYPYDKDREFVITRPDTQPKLGLNI